LNNLIFLTMYEKKVKKYTKSRNFDLYKKYKVVLCYFVNKVKMYFVKSKFVTKYNFLLCYKVKLKLHPFLINCFNYFWTFIEIKWNFHLLLKLKNLNCTWVSFNFSSVQSNFKEKVLLKRMINNYLKNFFIFKNFTLKTKSNL